MKLAIKKWLCQTHTHTRCDQKALPCKHWIKGSVTPSYEVLPRISLNLLRRYHTKNKQQRTFEALVVGLFYSSWKTLSPARHESQRHTFSSGQQTFQLPSKQFNHRIITMMNTRIMNSMSSIIHNLSPLLRFLFQQEFISSAWLSFKWRFIAVFFCYLCKFLMFIWPAQRPCGARKQQNCKHRRRTLAP